MSNRQYSDSDYYDSESDYCSCDKCKKRESYTKPKSKKCEKPKKCDKPKKCKCQHQEPDKNIEVKNDANCITITIKQCS